MILLACPPLTTTQVRRALFWSLSKSLQSFIQARKWLSRFSCPEMQCDCFCPFAWFSEICTLACSLSPQSVCTLDVTIGRSLWWCLCFSGRNTCESLIWNPELVDDARQVVSKRAQDFRERNRPQLGQVLDPYLCLHQCFVIFSHQASVLLASCTGGLQLSALLQSIVFFFCLLFFPPHLVLWQLCALTLCWHQQLSNRNCFVSIPQDQGHHESGAWLHLWSPHETDSIRCRRSFAQQIRFTLPQGQGANFVSPKRILSPADRVDCQKTHALV